MSDLEEVTMALIPLVKRDHPRWTTNQCKQMATREAKRFMRHFPKKRMDWSKIPEAQCDIISKRIRVF